MERGTTARLSLSNLARKINFRNREYNKVEDLYDTRIPLHNEEAFQHGIAFKAKFIGSLEIARPTCKIDIITAMRRIRYEYKVKGIRKVRCYMNISTTGVKISKRKRRRSRKKYSEEQLFVMQHPIYRIFYVSHDSQDLKIFSYITREVPDNTFRCNVFKAYKKGLALTIVRSLGQAFDVCHKLNPKPVKKKKDTDSTPEVGVSKEVEEEEVPGEGGDSGELKKEDLGSPKSLDSGPSAWKKFNTDLDSALEAGGVGEEDKKISDLNNDLMQLNFDPFSMPLSFPVANGDPMSMDPFQPISSGAGGNNGAVAYPPLTVSNLSNSLPDFPDGVDPAKASANIPPPHMALLGRPRPQTSVSGQQQVVTENMFTDPNQSHAENESPISIGEALDSSKVGNPFLPVDTEKGKWESEKQQFSLQMKMMNEQLESEKAARIQSQARVEHLLMQNKELLSHLQKLMSQLAQIQSLQQQLAPPTSTTSPPLPQTAPTTSSDTTLPISTGTPSPTSGHPASKTSSPLTEEDSALLAATTTSSPSPTQLTNEMTDPASAVTLSSTPKKMTNESTDDQAAFGNMELDFSFPASNDPFVPKAGYQPLSS